MSASVKPPGRSVMKVIAGTRPAAFWRSRDAGRTWSQLAAGGISQFSDVNVGPTRVTQILFDPVDDGTVWASVEIGSIYRSKDRGLTWARKENGLVSGDVHGLAVMRSKNGGKIVFATTNRGLHRSGVKLAVSLGARTADGIVVYRFGTSVYYANAAKLAEDVMALEAFRTAGGPVGDRPR